MKKGVLPPIGFLSYARQDDEYSGQKLSKLRELIKAELQLQYGRETVKLFQDVTTIPHGAAWESETLKALSESSFFIPIITPNFIQSGWCCREVELFLEREQELFALHPDLPRHGRIFPIDYRRIREGNAFDPEVLEILKRRQWCPFQDLRDKDMQGEAVSRAIGDFAESICDLLLIEVDVPPSPEELAAAEEARRQAEEAARLEAVKARRRERRAAKAAEQAAARARQEAETVKRRREQELESEQARKHAEGEEGQGPGHTIPRIAEEEAERSGQGPGAGPVPSESAVNEEVVGFDRSRVSASEADVPLNPRKRRLASRLGFIEGRATDLTAPGFLRLWLAGIDRGLLLSLLAGIAAFPLLSDLVPRIPDNLPFYVDTAPIAIMMPAVLYLLVGRKAILLALYLLAAPPFFLFRAYRAGADAYFAFDVPGVENSLRMFAAGVVGGLVFAGLSFLGVALLRKAARSRPAVGAALVATPALAVIAGLGLLADGLGTTFFLACFTVFAVGLVTQTGRLDRKRGPRRYPS